LFAWLFFYTGKLAKPIPLKFSGTKVFFKVLMDVIISKEKMNTPDLGINIFGANGYLCIFYWSQVEWIIE
jgi:hypothetical protein